MLALFWCSNSSLAVFDQRAAAAADADVAAGGEVGLRLEDLCDCGMTKDDRDCWGGGVMGREAPKGPLLGGANVGGAGGECDGPADPGPAGPLPAACCIRQWILNQLERRPYLDPDLDIPTIKHLRRRQALQAVLFFLSTTHLKMKQKNNVELLIKCLQKTKVDNLELNIVRKQ